MTTEVVSESREGIRKVLGMKNTLADRTSVGVGKSKLLTADEIMKLPPNELLIVFQRHNPVWANSTPYYLHPYSKGIKNISDDEEPDIYDSAERKKRREEENRYRLEYWSRHKEFEPPDNVRDAPYKKEPRLPDEIIEILIEDLSCIFKRKKREP